MTTERKIHQGRNVKRFREMLGMKQEALALELGDDWNQKKISLLEAKEEIEPELLEQVSKVLKVPGEAIKNFDEEKAIYNIQNNYEGSNQGVSHVSVTNYQCTFNPLDKMVELYERMLKDKQGMIERLERMMQEKD